MIRNDTSVGSLHTHQCPHEPRAQIEPVISVTTPKIRLMWIVTYERRSQR